MTVLYPHAMFKRKLSHILQPFYLRFGIPFFLCQFSFLAFSTNIYPDEMDFEVTVIDEKGSPLVGVNVYTKDQTRVAETTDPQGKVILKELSDHDKIYFSFIGYQSLRLTFHEIKKRHGIIQLFPEVSQLAEITVIGRRDDLPDNVPYRIQKIDKKDIAFTNAQTAADALRDHAEVFVQKSQMGGGSPIIRGFEANRVLLVLDGVRMNNAIYREGHLQNSITVDNAMLERMEVIFGPGSLIYGSGALGGVVHFRSKNPKLYFDGDSTSGQLLETDAYSRYSSANNEKSIHADFNFGRRKWGLLTSLTFTDYGDLEAGNRRPKEQPDFGKRSFYVKRVGNKDEVMENFSNRDVQIETGFAQVDFLQKLRFQPNQNFNLIANLQYSTTGNVPRYDRLTDTLSSARELKFAEWFYGPQKRLLASLRSEVSTPNLFFDKTTLIASFQKIDEDRHKRKLNATHRTFNLEDVFVYSFTADFDKKLDASGRDQLAYGIDFSYNKVTSKAGRINLDNESISRDVLTRYPARGNRMSSLGVYMNYSWKSRDSIIHANAGLRYSRVGLHSRFSSNNLVSWPDSYLSGIGTENNNLSWGVGLTLHTKDHWRMRWLGSSAFRSPNIDDFSKVREKNGFVTIPNPSLRPERSVNGEMTVAKGFGALNNSRETAFEISATGFYTHLRDAIVRSADTLPDGSNLLIIEGENLKTLSNQNQRKANVFGVSGNVRLTIAPGWKLQSGINFTKGRSRFKKQDEQGNAVIDTLLPFAHIPPLYGQSSLTYQAKKFKISAVARYNVRKKIKNYAITDIALNSNGGLEIQRTGSSDNIEQAFSHKNSEGKTVFDGTFSWTTYNLYTSWQLSQKLTFDFAVENISDVHYRPFSSGVSAAGRNFIMALRGTF